MRIKNQDVEYRKYELYILNDPRLWNWFKSSHEKTIMAFVKKNLEELNEHIEKEIKKNPKYEFKKEWRR